MNQPMIDSPATTLIQDGFGVLSLHAPDTNETVHIILVLDLPEAFYGWPLGEDHDIRAYPKHLWTFLIGVNPEAFSGIEKREEPKLDDF